MYVSKGSHLFCMASYSILWFQTISKEIIKFDSERREAKLADGVCRVMLVPGLVCGWCYKEHAV